jgi:hypothetical protein
VTALETLDAESWAGFQAAPASVLVLGKSDCPSCAAWSEDLARFLDADTRWRGVRFGKLLLDGRGLIDFKRANPWIAGLEVLPHNALYRSGERVAEFTGAGIERLEARLERIFGALEA